MKETFARNKVLSVLVLILLLTNILLLVFFVWMKPDDRHSEKPDRDGRKGGVTQLLETQVGFSAAQMAQYKSLKEQHWDKMRPYFGEIRTAKDRFYKLLSSSVAADSLTVSAAADSIAAKQKQIDMQTFRHFQQVRNICTPAQQPAFDSMVQQVLRRMYGPRRSGSKDKNDSVKK